MIKNFKAAVEAKTRRKLKVLHTDHGGSLPRWSLGSIARSRVYNDS
jgi:hypothetical protein